MTELCQGCWEAGIQAALYRVLAASLPNAQHQVCIAETDVWGGCWKPLSAVLRPAGDEDCLLVNMACMLQTRRVCSFLGIDFLRARLLRSKRTTCLHEQERKGLLGHGAGLGRNTAAGWLPAGSPACLILARGKADGLAQRPLPLQREREYPAGLLGKAGGEGEN